MGGADAPCARTATGTACPDDRSDHSFSTRRIAPQGAPYGRRTSASLATVELRPDERRLEEPLATELVSQLEGWTSDGIRLEKTFTLKGWKSAIAFVGRVAEAASEADHHPDIHVERYRNVRIVLTTHVSKGISRSDIDLARAIDRLAEAPQTKTR